MPSISTEDLLAKLKGLPQFHIPNMIPAQTASNAGAAVADMGEKLAAPKADTAPPVDSSDTQALVQQLKSLLNPPPPTTGQAILGAMGQFSRAGFQDPGKAQELENQRTALNQQNMANRARMVMDQIQNQRQQNYQNAEIQARNRELGIAEQEQQNKNELQPFAVKEAGAKATTAQNVAQGILNPLQESEAQKNAAEQRKANAEAKIKELESGNLPQSPEDYQRRLDAILPPNDPAFAGTNKRFSQLKAVIPSNPQAYGDYLKQADETARQIEVQRMGAQSRAPFQIQVAQATQAGPRFDHSYALAKEDLEAKAKPVDELTKSIGNLRDTLSLGSSVSQALIAPQVLKMMAGGEGSGLRMTQSELQQINQARTYWEGVQSSLSRLSPQAQSAMVMTPEQVQSVKQLMAMMEAKSAPKQTIINKARRDLVDAPDIETHKKIVADMGNSLSAVDAGAAPAQQAQPTGQPAVTHRFNPATGLIEEVKPNGR